MAVVVGSSVQVSEATADWLLDPGYPLIRRLALRDVLAGPDREADERSHDGELAGDPWVIALIRGAAPADQGSPHPYAKWLGSHWRLITLAELGVSARAPGLRVPLDAMFDEVLLWLASPSRERRIRQPVSGRVRMCASQEGAAIWVATMLGLTELGRLDSLVDRLLDGQWPDGGWNCDKRPAANHSSFNETWMPLRSLAAFAGWTRGEGGPVDSTLEAAIEAAADFLLRHHIVESERTGQVAHPRLLELRWPAYWHYGLLPGLLTITEAGYGRDPRVGSAVGRLRDLMDGDGRLAPTGRWWRRPGASGAYADVIDWSGADSRLLTLQALRVLSSAG